MPVQIDQVTTEVSQAETRSAGSSQGTQQSGHPAQTPREVEKLVRLLAERLLRVTAH